MTPRTARIIQDGGTYHVLTRGNNGQTLFHDSTDCQRYLQLLAYYAGAHQLKMYHFVLMPNHVHLLLEVTQGESLSRAMRGLNLSYSLFYQKRHRSTGHLWQGRYNSLQIDRDAYLLECGRYIELNPVRAGLVQNPKEYPWSSYLTYAQGAVSSCLAPNPLYETFGARPSQRQLCYRAFIKEGMRPQPPLPTQVPHGLIDPTYDPLAKARRLLTQTVRRGRPSRLKLFQVKKL